MEHYHGGTKRERERALAKIHRRGGVCFTSYGMLVNNAQLLAERDGRDYTWVINLYADELVQERRNSIAKALELRLSCTNPSMCGIFVRKPM